MIEELSDEQSTETFTLEPPLSSEEIVKVLARVCIDPLDHRTSAEIAAAMVLKGFVER
jgi:hypothetical protein